MTLWRKVKVDRYAWPARSLADEDIVRLILEGTVMRTRIDKRATNVSAPAAMRHSIFTKSSAPISAT